MASAAYAFMGVLEGSGWGMGFTVEGYYPKNDEGAAAMCNAVSPGFIETEGYADWDPVEQARWRSHIPLGRFGKPDEVAEAVAFLVSEKAGYVSGSVLHVHGGLWV